MGKVKNKSKKIQHHRSVIRAQQWNKHGDTMVKAYIWSGAVGEFPEEVTLELSEQEEEGTSGHKEL